MNLKEVERRLRCGDWNVGFADAIKAHRERCVDAEKVRALRDQMARCGSLWVREMNALLPPRLGPLDRAIEAVENWQTSGISYPQLLDLLREAKEEG